MRRRQACGRHNSGDIALKKWFRNEKRYTMITGFGINGFEKTTVGIFYAMKCQMREQQGEWMEKLLGNV